MIKTMRISNCSVCMHTCTALCYYLRVLFFRLLKIRCEKNKFQASSTSTKQVFQNVLDEMNKCAPKNIGIYVPSHVTLV